MILENVARILPRSKNNYYLKAFHKKLLQLKLRAFQPKLTFEYKNYNFVVKTAQTKEELEAVLKLRHEVFIREGLGSSNMNEVDFDRYDLLADHILVKDLATGQVVGTYRLLCSLFTSDFYSESEFYLERLVNAPGVKLELGRACIHPDFRTGATLNLVWKGIAHYVLTTQADYLFGCASVKTTCPHTTNRLFNHLKDDHFSPEYLISPRSKYQFSNKMSLVKEEVENLDQMLPSLFKSYLSAGAKVHSYPAYDKDFKCIDFLTILKMKDLSQKYFNRYFKEDKKNEDAATNS